jgi:hypothetical protein
LERLIQTIGHHDTSIHGIHIPCERGRDDLKLGALRLKQEEPIEGDQRSAKADGNALARMGADTHPVQAPINAPPLRFRTYAADANDGIESPTAYSTHAVLVPKYTVGVRIARVGPLIDQYSHSTAPFLAFTPTHPAA